MKTASAEAAGKLLEESWRLTPARMAERLTGGRFQRYRHVRFLENRIARALAKGGARLIITLPPRHGKSWLGSLFTPAWFLSLWPERHVILTTHDAAVASDWSRGVRDFLSSHENELLVRLSRSERAASRWRTAQGGGMFATGVGGPVAASGGSLILVDDPIKSWKAAMSAGVRQAQIDWFNTALLPRAEPGASVVIIMTRWHNNDLAGHLAGKVGEWETLRIPAIAEKDDVLARPIGTPLCEERFGIDVLRSMRGNLGPSAWNALYQQEPGEEGEGIPRIAWKHYDALPDGFDEVIQSWDLSFKGEVGSDYVVGQVWGRRGEDAYIIDQIRGKKDFPATLEAVRELSRRYPRTSRILVEDRANGSAAVAVLRDEIPGLVAVKTDAGKQERLRRVRAWIERGRVFLPSPATEPWVEDFKKECNEFPRGRNDDQVDAMAYALGAWGKGNLDAGTQCAGGADLSDSFAVDGSPAGVVGS